jgi:hypothetical protein
LGRDAGAQKLDDELQAVHLGPRVEVVELGGLLLVEEPPVFVLVEDALEVELGDPFVLSGHEVVGVVDASALLKASPRVLGAGELASGGRELLVGGVDLPDKGALAGGACRRARGSLVVRLTPGGIDSTRFSIDWEAREATCPQGKKCRYWKPELNRHGRDVVAVLFAKAVCGACESHPLCTRSRFTGRELTLRPQPQHEVLLEARKRQATEEFWEEYHARAGVEGTVSQGVRGFGLRRSRYVGTAKTHLQHLITAVAMNVVRLLVWFAGVPKARTRLSAFARLTPEGC